MRLLYIFVQWPFWMVRRPLDDLTDNFSLFSDKSKKGIDKTEKEAYNVKHKETYKSY